MKIFDYLEAIKEDIVYQEVISLSNPQEQINMTLLDGSFLKKHKGGLLDILDYLFTFHTRNRIYKTFEDFFSDSQEEVNRKIKKYYRYNIFSINRALKAAEVLNEFKGNKYYKADNTLLVFVFIVGGKKMYQAYLKKLTKDFDGQDITYHEISFSYIKGFEDYPLGSKSSNNLFSDRVAGSELFKKIAGIIKNEIPDWEKTIFAFEPVEENKEKHNNKSMSNVMDDLSSALNSYFTKSGMGVDYWIRANRESLKQINQRTRNSILKIIKKGINRQKIYNHISEEEFNLANSFIDSLFNGREINPLSKKLFNNSIDWVTKNDIEEENATNTMRTRLYKSVVRQMFGEVHTRQLGSMTFFSKSPLSKEAE